MAYADVEFYINEYKGTADPGQDLEGALEHASYAVDYAVDYRIGNLEDWPPFSQRQIKLACCAEANHSLNYGEIEEMTSILGGYSIGDVSINGSGGASGGGGVARHFRLCPEAFRFLLPTGLLDRRRR